MKLIPKSKKGRERVKRDGDTGWEILRTSDRVLFSSDPGPWWFIENATPNSARWIHSKNDVDFELDWRVMFDVNTSSREKK